MGTDAKVLLCMKALLVVSALVLNVNQPLPILGAAQFTPFWFKKWRAKALQHALSAIERAGVGLIACGTDEPLPSVDRPAIANQPVMAHCPSRLPVSQSA